MIRTPATYIKRPVEVKAMRMYGGVDRALDICMWLEENFYHALMGDASDPKTLRDPNMPEDHIPVRGHWIDPLQGTLMIRTLEGDMRVGYGDWVILGVAGEFYPCKHDIFMATYAAVEE